MQEVTDSQFTLRAHDRRLVYDTGLRPDTCESDVTIEFSHDESTFSEVFCGGVERVCMRGCSLSGRRHEARWIGEQGEICM